MKRYIICLFYVIFFGVANASYYLPIVEHERKVWSMYANCAVDCADYIISSEELLEDTVINGIIYQTYYKKHTNNGPTEYIAAIRDDKVNKLVYIIPAGQNTEKLLYTFNVHPGEHVSAWGGAQQDMQDYVVLGVQKVQGRTNVHVQTTRLNTTYDEVWIEGIGSKYGVVTRPYMNAIVSGCTLPIIACVSTQNALLYNSEFIQQGMPIMCDTCWSTEYHPMLSNRSMNVMQEYEKTDDYYVDTYTQHIKKTEFLYTDFYYDFNLLQPVNNYTYVDSITLHENVDTKSVYIQLTNKNANQKEEYLWYQFGLHVGEHVCV